MDKTLNIFIEKLKETFEKRLSSIFLYGSSATEEVSKSSDLNLIVIIENLKAEDLKKAHKAIADLSKKTKSLPLLMDKDEWFNSSDVYAIEYSDIKERHKILYGEDLINSINYEKSHLRFQCEQETKNLLIRLRQTYLANTNNNRVLQELIKASSKTIMVILRTILRLKDLEVPKLHKDVVLSISERVTDLNFDKEQFLNILEFRTNKKAISGEDFEDVTQKLINTTSSVLKYVDKL